MSDTHSNLAKEGSDSNSFESMLNLHASICFNFWRSLHGMGVNFPGWRLSAYWRNRGYYEQ